MLEITYYILQVDCTPPGDILAKVVKSRPSGGNYIGLALLAVAGEGTITAVEIKGQTVRGTPCHPLPPRFPPSVPNQYFHQQLFRIDMAEGAAAWILEKRNDNQ